MSGHSVFPLDVNHTLHLALKQQKRANRDEEGTGNCQGGARGRGNLGSIVLFAVGFIAQNAVDLVDDGRRQFWKDLHERIRVYPGGVGG